MDFMVINETFEIYSEFAKHILSISNKSGLLNIYLKNINLGLIFQNSFSLENLIQLTNENFNYSTINSFTLNVCDAIHNKKFSLTTSEGKMIISVFMENNGQEIINIPLSYKN